MTALRGTGTVTGPGSSLALLTWRAHSPGITFRKEKLFSFSVSSFLAQAAPRHLSDGTLLQQPGARRLQAGRACHAALTHRQWHLFQVTVEDM